MRIFTADGFFNKIASYSKTHRIIGTENGPKLLGVDFGTKHIGFAISDEQFQVAFPYVTYERKHFALVNEAKPSVDDIKGNFDSIKARKITNHQNYESRMNPGSLYHAAEFIDNIVSKNYICGIVVGFPLLDNGSPSKLCNEIVEFMTNIPLKPYLISNGVKGAKIEPVCTMWNENGSTVSARERIKGRSLKRSVFIKNKDKTAASIILQSYLNSLHTTDDFDSDEDEDD